jgi:hypothetical protein
MGSQRATRQSRFFRQIRHAGTPAAILLALVAAGAIAASCGESPAPTPASGSDAAPADADPEPEPDAALRPIADAGPPTSCVAIRNCLVRCQADSACAQRCVDGASAPARTQYQSVVTCSRRVCATDDMNCRCEQECQGGGECLEIVDGCRGPELAEDLFCDELCM